MPLILPSFRGPSLRTNRFTLSLAAAGAALAAWLSQGTLAVTAASGPRIALLPLSPLAIAVALVAGLAVAVLAWRAGTTAPALLLALVALPWLPFPVPAAFLIWTAPLAAVVWIAVFAVLMVSARVPASAVARRAAARPALAAGVIACAVYSLAAWRVAPALPGGDEPHYLVITQSLLYDHDLKIENNHRRGDYRAYFAGELRPDFLRRGRNGEIYSIHAPGVSALVLPAFAVAGYRGVVVFLVLLSSLAAALAWWLAWRVTGRSDAAWFGWAAAALAPTTVLNAFTVYPDGPGALAVLTGAWALVRARDERGSGAESVRPWLLHGAALAVLPWLHTRFALLAGGLGAVVLLQLARTRNPVAKASAFLAVPAASALAWIAFFGVIYGAPDPAMPYRGSDLGSPSYIASGLAGLLFDQQYGLLVYAPALAAALAGLIALARQRGVYRWLSAELVFVAAPYLLTVTHFAMWWGGLSAPARFFLPLIPLLAISAAAAWAAATERGTRAVMMAALFATGFVSGILVLVDHGRLAYHARELYAGWLPWLSRTVDLQRALPSFFARQRVLGRARTMETAFYVEIAVWVAVLAAAWLVLRWVGARRATARRTALATAAAAVLAAAVMLACAIVWRIEGVGGLTPAAAQLALLRDAGASSRIIALDVSRARRLPAGGLPQQLSIRTEAASSAPAGPGADRPIFALPAIPAGAYRLTVRQANASGGWLMAGIGRDQFSIVTRPASDFASDIPIRFPVDVRAIVVRGDEEARRAGGVLELRPVSILARSEKAWTGRALHAVRYGDATIYFMDDLSFPEPDAFWLHGACDTTVVLQPDTPRPAAALLVRNAPVANEVEIQAGAWTAPLSLNPGDERRIEVPLDTRRGATAITFRVKSGFRPSEASPQSRDERFLGVWVKLE